MPLFKTSQEYSHSALYRTTDDKGYNLTAEYKTLKRDGSSTYNAQWKFTETDVTVWVDGVALKSGETNYQFKKPSGALYTINDFLVDGNPSVYFCADEGYSFSKTIYGQSGKELGDVEFDFAKWNTYEDTPTALPTDDKISVTGGIYYKNAITQTNYDQANNKMQVNIKFAINALNQYTSQFVPFITSSPINSWQESWGKVGNSADTIAVRMYYASDWRWNNNSISARVCDYKDYSSSGYATINPTNGEEHTISFCMDSEKVFIVIDGKKIETEQNTGIAYLCQKASGVNYTINDFIKDGQPSVYFGVLCNEAFGSATINGNVIKDDGLAEMFSNSLKTLGASIRATTNCGLRFENVIDKGHYDYFVDKYSVENVTLGTLIIPKDLVPNENITLQTQKVQNTPRTTWFNEEGRFNVVLTQIPQEAYGREIVARTYITIDDGVNQKTFYGKPIVRSVEAVASAALEDYDKETVATASSPEIRSDVNGFNFLVTFDEGSTYWYSRYRQDQIDILLTMSKKK